MCANYELTCTEHICMNYLCDLLDCNTLRIKLVTCCSFHLFFVLFQVDAVFNDTTYSIRQIPFGYEPLAIRCFSIIGLRVTFFFLVTSLFLSHALFIICCQILLLFFAGSLHSFYALPFFSFFFVFSFRSFSPSLFVSIHFHVMLFLFSLVCPFSLFISSSNIFIHFNNTKPNSLLNHDKITDLPISILIKYTEILFR